MPQSAAADRWLSTAPGPGGEHGGHEEAVARQPSVPDRVDALMDAVQRSASEPILDRPPGEPQPGKLGARHDAVLARGELRDRDIGSDVRFPM